eukprot:531689_1
MSLKTDRKYLVSKAQTLQEYLLSNGLIKDRTYNLKTYKQCFVGREVIPVMISLNLMPTSDLFEKEINAITFGNALIQSNIIKHVTSDHTFKNEKLFYEFISGYNNSTLSPQNFCWNVTNPLQAYSYSHKALYREFLDLSIFYTPLVNCP